VAPSTPEPVSDEQAPPQPAIKAAATIASVLSPVTQKFSTKRRLKRRGTATRIARISSMGNAHFKQSGACFSANMDEIVAKCWRR